jgi:DNA helicase-2/ATP-dependent DNA helicase PcrA
MLVADKTEEANDRLENISELVSAAGEYTNNEERTGLQAFLDQVALVSDVDGFDSEAGAVTLMTMHLAKGLEFRYVFMVGMEENLFPHARSMDDPDELEEERRLCYVGMTRAMERLTMMYALRRFHFGQYKFGLASRFLDEIPEKFVEWKKKRDYVKSFFPSRPSYTNDGFTGHESRLPAGAGVTGHDTDGDFDYDFDQRPPDELQTQSYRKGMRVSHPSFGDGIIKQCERTPSGHKVTVQFRSGFSKRLIAELANLMPI